jgi:hypothetical protein
VSLDEPRSRSHSAENVDPTRGVEVADEAADGVSDEDEIVASADEAATAEGDEGRVEDAPLALRWRVGCRALGIGCLVHLSLPDAHRLDWLVPNVVLAASAISLLFVPRPGTPRASATFVGIVVAKLVPLIFLGDQLTQSLVLALYASSALLFARAMPPRRDAPRRDAVDASTSRDAPRDVGHEPDAPHDATHARAVRLLLLGVYGLAAFHKTNRDFLDPAVSCATGGMRLLADNWSLPFPEGATGAMWPHLFLATEAALVLLGTWRPAWALLIAIAMHVPLTIVFAPAFAWVMLPGWVAFLRDEDLAHLGHVARTRRGWVLGLGLGAAIVSATLYFRDHWIPYPAWQLVELSLWILLAWLVVALVTRRGGALVGRLAWNERAGRFAFVPLAILLANGTTPYLGLQFHHTAAMLSNLRIDAGCWNHLLVPESVRIVDPYVRVETMTVGPRTPGPEVLITIARESLWHPASLRDATARWCEAGAAPIGLELRYEGRTLEVEDACTHLPLPSQTSGLFQTNLPRECPARCIH